ncbi:hypothetical protein FRD01_17055 [Microvenator marinus]|uniref:Uncharacterized protein n=1 Tax=Microvenator marinus TaxID=2600177 RepID=A0A5B8XUS0_9DELT|nr:hypothetical protein [Microvenator marinus]QED28917.1 hypothetical protein FRD01_17055 [Microvenator marinus]
MKNRQFYKILLCALGVLAAGCVDTVESVPPGELIFDSAPPEAVFEFANACVRIEHKGELLTRDGERYEWGGEGTPFLMRASDLGTYLFYDDERGYLLLDLEGVEAGAEYLKRRTELESDITRVDDSFVSPAEWQLEVSDQVSNAFNIRRRQSNFYMGPEPIAVEPVPLKLIEAEGCATFPELSLDATGTPAKTKFEDGDLFGFVDAHSHILSNFGFGGGGIFHGAPFHRLGVEHALGSCEQFHGEDGRADFLGAGDQVDQTEIISLLSTGLLPEPSHTTDGWPTFTDWPSTEHITHQTQYYIWLKRAWMAGMRLVVQHAVSNEVFCDLMADTGFQPVRWDCRDMLNVDRQIEEVRVMERYIDAQEGGPGKGWFRVVESPEDARAVIAEGKLAVILGIEVPNLFECYLTRRPDDPICDRDHIEAQLDEYYAKGIRAIFPNHKYDNAFTPGDGHRGIVELGNFVQTAHYSNFVQDCPDVPTTFDYGPVQFGGINEPREDYLAPAPNELLEFSMSPLRDLLPYLQLLQEPALEGDWCQAGGLTEAGRDLIRGIMERGMIPEIDHLPRRTYVEVFEMLEEANYPAAATHGNTNRGKLYEIGGLSIAGISRCSTGEPGSLMRGFRAQKGEIDAAGAYPGLGFGFDFNGMATMPRPRFGDLANCGEQQSNPVEYPFVSFDGAVEFTQPLVGERVVDFNTEGMVHIGLVAELLEDARRDGATDEDFELIFRSAEAYIRMWEKASLK